MKKLEYSNLGKAGAKPSSDPTGQRPVDHGTGVTVAMVLVGIAALDKCEEIREAARDVSDGELVAAVYGATKREDCRRRWAATWPFGSLNSRQ